MSLSISENGINLIKQFEGCRLSAYKDSVGVVTIGYGWTKAVDGKALTMGTTITQAKAESLLKEGLKSYEANVNKYDGKYNWNQNQFDALVSFAYNIGNIDQLTANGTRTVSQISSKFTAYSKAGGKTLQGLVDRRKKEKALFDTACSTSLSSSASSGAAKSASFNQRLYDLQQALNKDGIASPKLAEDGIWGTKTASAVKKCAVKYGSKGNTVSWVQGRVGTKTDGIAGNDTVSKIKKYQSSKGLTADGVAGYNTITAILRDHGVKC